MRYRHKNSEKNLISKKEAFDLLKEFKKFAFRSSFLDLSVGVVIGGSLNRIISSLVDNIIMPIFSLIVPYESSYKSWVISIYEKEIHIGLFLGDIITFLVVSFFLFLFIKKLLYWFFKEEEKTKEETLEEKTLLEIRDILLKLVNNHG